MLLKRLKDQIEDARYTLITEYYAAERQLLLDILRRFDRLYRERKAQAGMLDFSPTWRSTRSGCWRTAKRRGRGWRGSSTTS